MQDQGKLQLTKNQFCQFDAFLSDSMENIIDEVSIKIWINFKEKSAEIYRQWSQIGNEPEILNQFFSLVKRARGFFEVRREFI
jgi:hypothetical protein